MIGDPDRGDITFRNAGCRNGLSSHVRLGAPNFVCIVLYPPRLREVLRELPLRDRQHRARRVKYNGPRTRRALIQRHDHFHDATSCVAAQRNFADAQRALYARSLACGTITSGAARS